MTFGTKLRMIRKDYIEKQLEQLSIAISKIIAEIRKAQTVTQINSAISISTEFLKKECECSLEEISKTEPSQTIEFLTQKKKISTEKINLFAELLYEISVSYEKSGKYELAIDLNKKLLTIYNYLNETDKTFSLKRQEKITIIKSKL